MDSLYDAEEHCPEADKRSALDYYHLEDGRLSEPRLWNNKGIYTCSGCMLLTMKGKQRPRGFSRVVRSSFENPELPDPPGGTSERETSISTPKTKPQPPSKNQFAWFLLRVPPRALRFLSF